MTEASKANKPSQVPYSPPRRAVSLTAPVPQRWRFPAHDLPSRALLLGRGLLGLAGWQRKRLAHLALHRARRLQRQLLPQL